MLINKGANVNIINEDIKCSPLHHSVSLGSVIATRSLLAAGASLELEELLGETSLHVAAAVGNVDVLKVLLEYDPKYNLINSRDKV